MMEPLGCGGYIPDSPVIAPVSVLLYNLSTSRCSITSRPTCEDYIIDPPVIAPVSYSTVVVMHTKNEKPDL
jgi:hypothetical protein